MKTIEAFEITAQILRLNRPGYRFEVRNTNRRDGNGEGARTAIIMTLPDGTEIAPLSPREQERVFGCSFGAIGRTVDLMIRNIRSVEKRLGLIKTA